MRAVLQRVTHAEVEVSGQTTGKITRGWLVLLGVECGDTQDDARYLAEKTVHMRAFSDPAGKFNLSLKDVGGDVLVVSQFTLLGDCRKGRRPSFSRAAPIELASALYEVFCRQIAEVSDHTANVHKGVFQSHMKVSLTNDGPVTMLLDSKKIF